MVGDYKSQVDEVPHTVKLPPVYTVAPEQNAPSSHISWDEKQKPGPHTNRLHKFISTLEVISEYT